MPSGDCQTQYDDISQMSVANCKMPLDKDIAQKTGALIEDVEFNGDEFCDRQDLINDEF